MADNQRPSDPGKQEQLVERHPHHQDPTRLDEERTSDNSTVDNGGVGSAVGENPDFPVMPGDWPTLRRKSERRQGARRASHPAHTAHPAHPAHPAH